MHFWPWARFSKVPETLRAQKVIRKTPTRLFCEAGPFSCCKGNKNEKRLPSFVPRDAFVVKTNRELSPELRPKSPREFRETGPRIQTLYE